MLYEETRSLTVVLDRNLYICGHRKSDATRLACPAEELER